jgi:hypothetical protein
MKRINAQSIGSVLDVFFEENPDLADKLAEVRLLNSWKMVLGPAASRFTDNLFIKKRTLYVKLNSSVLKSELSLGRDQLVKKLNDKAGRNVIDAIVLI